VLVASYWSIHLAKKHITFLSKKNDVFREFASDLFNVPSNIPFSFSLGFVQELMRCHFLIGPNPCC